MLKTETVESAVQLNREELFRFGTALIFIVGVMLFTIVRTDGGVDGILLVVAAMIGGYMAINIGANDVANNVGQLIFDTISSVPPKALAAFPSMSLSPISSLHVPELRGSRANGAIKPAGRKGLNAALQLGIQRPVWRRRDDRAGLAAESTSPVFSFKGPTGKHALPAWPISCSLVGRCMALGGMRVSVASMVRRGLRKLRGERAFPLDTVHFLHVGKAAGTQISRVIEQVNDTRRAGKLVTHGHDVGLADLPGDQGYFFSTRDPATRFKSGFYSRFRKGQPRLYVEWSDHEQLAFKRFPHANDLAEALFQPGRTGRDAAAAIRSIRHCSRNLVDWFKFCGHLFEVRPPIWIIRQESFSADLDVFLERIGHGEPVDLTTDRKDSHANDYDGIPDLSEPAMANLRRWYAQDYEFLDMCETWMNETLRQDSMVPSE